jgi:hypothetical protein
MKKSKLIILLAALAMAGTMTAWADNETSISGKMVCAKRVLHESDTCQNVVQVNENGNTVNYYLKQNKVSKEAHDPICKGGSEKVTVTGSVKEKDGKKIMTATKIEVDKS